MTHLSHRCRQCSSHKVSRQPVKVGQVSYLTGVLSAVIGGQRELMIRALPRPAFTCTRFMRVACGMFSAGVKCGRDGSVDHHMEMGKKLLAAGQLADALSHFHAAVGKGRCRAREPSQTCLHAEVSGVRFTGSGSPSFLFRWRSTELHGLLQQSDGVSGHGEVQVRPARPEQSH